MDLTLLILIIIIFLWICWSIRAQPCTIIMSVVALWLLVWILILLFTDISRLHVLWIIPVGALIIPRAYNIIIKIPILRYIILIAATTLRNIIWIGIDKNKREAEIKKSLHQMAEETSRDFFEKIKK
ncbi:hypothetical protein BMS3Abin15_00129 [bacterium BMS3Abin15]|nr:hypothetical protein BMS3Abin15_00129 [bacterium BMS3Abin15]